MCAFQISHRGGGGKCPLFNQAAFIGQLKLMRRDRKDFYLLLRGRRRDNTYAPTVVTVRKGTDTHVFGVTCCQMRAHTTTLEGYVRLKCRDQRTEVVQQRAISIIVSLLHIISFLSQTSLCTVCAIDRAVIRMTGVKSIYCLYIV